MNEGDGVHIIGGNQIVSKAMSKVVFLCPYVDKGREIRTGN